MECHGDEGNCVMLTFKLSTIYFSPNDRASTMLGENETFVQNILR